MTALTVASAVTDPELPVLTLADLGVLRDVAADGDRVVVTITPTYSGCPAMATMRDDLVRSLGEAGYADVEVRTQLAPAWSSDWISQAGKAKLAAAGISPPGAVATTTFVSLSPTRRLVTCPQCGSRDTSVVSEFGSTACKALYRCDACLEPFDHVKEI